MKGGLLNLFAQGAGGRSVPELLHATPTAKSLWEELGSVTVVLLAALVVGLILFLAVYWWKRQPGDESVSVSGAAHHPHHRGKRRKRLRAHRPRNPTLAETGGLPPLRDDGPPSSSS